MQNPLRKKHEIELGGVKYALRFERYDFALAQRDLGEPFFPYGATPVWQAISRLASVDTEDPLALAALDADAEVHLACLHLLFAGLRRSVAGITMDWITERVDEGNLGDVMAAIMPALADFFLRLHEINEKAKVETPENESAKTGTSTTSAPGTEPISELATANSGA